jgi:hypothetical protein
MVRTSSWSTVACRADPSIRNSLRSRSCPRIRPSIGSIASSVLPSPQTLVASRLAMFSCTLRCTTSKPAHPVHTSKSAMIISVNPSNNLGSRYLEAKPVNATFGNIVRPSGFVCGNYQHRSSSVSSTTEPGH